MSFGGACSDMIASLKYNSRPKRRVYGDLKSHYELYKGAKTKEVNFEEFNEQDLELLKSEIQKENKALRRKSVLISVLLFLLLTASVVGGVHFL